MIFQPKYRDQFVSGVSPHHDYRGFLVVGTGDRRRVLNARHGSIEQAARYYRELQALRDRWFDSGQHGHDPFQIIEHFNLREGI